jgi:hypothetical protein
MGEVEIFDLVDDMDECWFRRGVARNAPTPTIADCGKPMLTTPIPADLIYFFVALYFFNSHTEYALCS